MDTLSDIPYEKGSVFLWYLEELVGGLTKMKKFLRHFLAKHFLKTLYSEDFKSTFLDYFKDTKGLNEIDWDTWFHGTGMPKEKVKLSNNLDYYFWFSFKPKYDETYIKPAVSLAESWIKWDGKGSLSFANEYENFSLQQQNEFFYSLSLADPLGIFGYPIPISVFCS